MNRFLLFFISYFILIIHKDDNNDHGDNDGDVISSNLRSVAADFIISLLLSVMIAGFYILSSYK